MSNYFKKNYTDFFKSKKTLLTIIAAIIGIVLIVLSYFSSDKGENLVQSSNESDVLLKYSNQLEEKLETTLSKITGDGTIDAMITFDSGFETVYASNAKLDGSSNLQNFTEKTLATANSQGTESPIIIKTLCPKISGVMIICSAKITPQTITAIKNAAATALNISQSKIYIIGGNATS